MDCEFILLITCGNAYAKIDHYITSLTNRTEKLSRKMEHYLNVPILLSQKRADSLQDYSNNE